MAETPLERIALFASDHYRAVFLVVAIAVGAGILLGLQLDFDTDVLNLLPEKEESLQTYRETLEEFGSLDYLVVAVRIPEGAILDPYEEFADALGTELEAVESLVDVEYSLGELEDLIRAFFPKAVFFLGESELEGLEERLAEERLDLRAQELRRVLSLPQGIALKPLLLLDPVGIVEVFFDQVNTSTAGLKLDWARGYFLSRDHRMLLILAQPIPAPQNVDATTLMLADVEQAVQRATGEWESIAGPDAPPPPEVVLGGRHVIALGDASIIRKDFVVNLLTATGGVLLLFLFAFRRFGPLLYAIVPLASGLAMTFGVSYLLWGGLSAATSGSAALLIGLGIDFVIVSYGRYVEERLAGKSLREALVRVSGSCGRAVVVGGVTSAATFYSFAVTDFRGLRQMGFLTGTGILLCMVAVLFLLPALLTWSDHRHTRRDSTPRHFLHGFGSGRLIKFCIHHPRPVLIASFVLTLVFGYAALDLRFEDSVRSMRPQGSEAVAFREEVAERFGSGFEYMMLLVRGESLDEVLATTERAAQAARALVEEGVLTGVDSISTVLPSASRQREVLDWLSRAREGELDPPQIRSRFEESLVRAGLRPEPFGEGLDLFEAALSVSDPIQIDEIEAEPQSRRLIERYLRQAGTEWRSVVYLYPPPKVWRRDAPPQAIALAEELGPDVTLTGGNVVSSVLRKSIVEDATIGVAVGFVLVAILLWIDYRRVSDTILSLAPLVMGIIWMLGIMAMAGIAMNFMNIFVTTMIIGIGVDYGVHQIHRFREIQRRGHGRLDLEVVETGRAIALAALSTMVGFGSLSLSHYPGLRSMGQVAILGALTTCLIALTVLPAYLELRGRRREVGRG